MLAATRVLRTSPGGMAAFAVFVITLCALTAPRAQVLGSLTGTVTDSQKAPLPGVKVTLVTTTTAIDFPDVRATKLAASIAELKGMNSESGNPLSGKLSGRYGTSGYSMGGGGTTIAASNDKTLVSSVGLAPWSPVGADITTPTLLMCGGADTVAPCSMAQGAYTAMPETTPKMMIVIPAIDHLAWLGGPTGPGQGGAFALAFMKAFLEGDERWKSVLLDADGSVTTNITR